MCDRKGIPLQETSILQDKATRPSEYNIGRAVGTVSGLDQLVSAAEKTERNLEQDTTD